MKILENKEDLRKCINLKKNEIILLNKNRMIKKDNKKSFSNHLSLIIMIE